MSKIANSGRIFKFVLLLELASLLSVQGMLTIDRPAAATLVSNSSENQQLKGQLAANRIKIGGVKQGASYSQVIKILGKPKRQQISEYMQAFGGKTVTLEYPELEVELVMFDSDKLSTANVYAMEIVSSKSKYATGDGIRIGDSKAKVLKTYGTPETTVVESGRQIIRYGRIPNDSTVFNFEIKNGKVVKISFVSQLN